MLVSPRIIELRSYEETNHQEDEGRIPEPEQHALKQQEVSNDEPVETVGDRGKGSLYSNKDSDRHSSKDSQKGSRKEIVPQNLTGSLSSSPLTNMLIPKRTIITSKEPMKKRSVMLVQPMSNPILKKKSSVETEQQASSSSNKVKNRMKRGLEEVLVSPVKVSSPFKKLLSSLSSDRQDRDQVQEKRGIREESCPLVSSKNKSVECNDPESPLTPYKNKVFTSNNIPSKRRRVYSFASSSSEESDDDDEEEGRLMIVETNESPKKSLEETPVEEKVNSSNKNTSPLETTGNMSRHSRKEPHERISRIDVYNRRRIPGSIILLKSSNYRHSDDLRSSDWSSKYNDRLTNNGDQCMRRRPRSGSDHRESSMKKISTSFITSTGNAIDSLSSSATSCYSLPDASNDQQSHVECSAREKNTARLNCNSSTLHETRNNSTQLTGLSVPSACYSFKNVSCIPNDSNGTTMTQISSPSNSGQMLTFCTSSQLNCPTGRNMSPDGSAFYRSSSIHYSSQVAIPVVINNRKDSNNNNNKELNIRNESRNNRNDSRAGGDIIRDENKHGDHDTRSSIHTRIGFVSSFLSSDKSKSDNNKSIIDDPVTTVVSNRKLLLTKDPISVLPSPLLPAARNESCWSRASTFAVSTACSDLACDSFPDIVDKTTSTSAQSNTSSSCFAISVSRNEVVKSNGFTNGSLSSSPLHVSSNLFMTRDERTWNPNECCPIYQTGMLRRSLSSPSYSSYDSCNNNSSSFTPYTSTPCQSGSSTTSSPPRDPRILRATGKSVSDAAAVADQIAQQKRLQERLIRFGRDPLGNASYERRSSYSGHSGQSTGIPNLSCTPTGTVRIRRGSGPNDVINKEVMTQTVSCHEEINFPLVVKNTEKQNCKWKPIRESSSCVAGNTVNSINGDSGDTNCTTTESNSMTVDESNEVVIPQDQSSLQIKQEPLDSENVSKETEEVKEFHVEIVDLLSPDPELDPFEADLLSPESMDVVDENEENQVVGLPPISSPISSDEGSCFPDVIQGFRSSIQETSTHLSTSEASENENCSLDDTQNKDEINEPPNTSPNIDNQRTEEDGIQPQFDKKNLYTNQNNSDDNHHNNENGCCKCKCKCKDIRTSSSSERSSRRDDKSRRKRRDITKSPDRHRSKRRSRSRSRSWSRSRSRSRTRSPSLRGISLAGTPLNRSRSLSRKRTLSPPVTGSHEEKWGSHYRRVLFNPRNLRPIDRHKSNTKFIYQRSRDYTSFDSFGLPDRDDRVTKTLYVGNLDAGLTDEEIKEYFDPLGSVELFFIKKHPFRRTNFGFVRYKNLLEAFYAREKLHRSVIGFFAVNVGYAKLVPSPHLWLGNLPKDVDTHFLYRELDRFGAIVRMDHFKLEGEVDVVFETTAAAQTARDELRGVILLPRSKLQEMELKDKFKDPSLDSEDCDKKKIRGVVTDFSGPGFEIINPGSSRPVSFLLNDLNRRDSVESRGSWQSSYIGEDGNLESLGRQHLENNRYVLNEWPTSPAADKKSESIKKIYRRDSWSHRLCCSSSPPEESNASSSISDERDLSL